MAVRRVVLVAVMGLFLFVAGAGSASAAEWPDAGGCGAEDVEVCQPVCVTDPCYGYVCVRSTAGEFCYRP